MKKAGIFSSCLILIYLFLSDAVHAQDQGWPREIKKDGHSLVYYQPQVENWKDKQVLEFKAAVMLKMSGEAQALAGAVWLRADTDVDMDNRIVLLNNIEPVRIRYSVVDSNLAVRAEQTTKAILPSGPIGVSLDRILSGISAAEEAGKQALPLKNDAPKIIVSNVPARLVIFDGEPIFAPVEGTNLQYVINTNWDLFSETAEAKYYLLDGNMWLTAADLKGPWKKTLTLPAGFAKFPLSDNWKDVKKNLPPSVAASSIVPTVYVTTTPAELIVLTGNAVLKPVKGTNLSYVSNTESDLFFYKGDTSYYYLVAGRWFRAKSLNGPWEFATTSLPRDFANIPGDHVKARLLASVPGTPEAQEAILVASIPQTAKVSRKEATLKVVYAGDPVFKPIEGTSMFYAVNTPVTVIQLGTGSYYACDRGVWFIASSSAGPWIVAASVPQVIYTIPASSPVYNVTYVKVYESTPDYVVTSYTSGYMMGFITAGVLVWGSGYYHSPYWHYTPAGFYPVYYPRPYTYGAAAWYNPATNSYYRGGYAYGPYGGIGAGAVYNPATGAYGRGFAAYGPYGGFKTGVAYNPGTGAWARGAAGYGPNGAWRAGYGYNPQTGVSFAGRQGTNVYGSWGQGVVKKGDQWVSGGHRQTADGTTGYLRGSEGGAAVKGKNNSYVGKDGEVYKKTDSGWQKYEDGGWNNVQKPTPAARQTSASARTATPAASQTEKNAGRFSGKPTAQQTPATRQFKTEDSSVVEGLNREAGARQQGEQRNLSWQGRSAGSPSERGDFGSGSRGGFSRGGGFSGGRRR